MEMKLGFECNIEKLFSCYMFTDETQMYKNDSKSCINLSEREYRIKKKNFHILFFLNEDRFN